MPEPLDVDAVLVQLDVAGRAALCSGSGMWHTATIRSGGAVVDGIRLADGPHGLRRPRPGGEQLGLGGSVPATCFPTASALASSWDVDLLRRVGAALGAECRAQGVSVLLGPGVNIKRSPLCGRNFEYLSEDPHLTGRLAVAMIAGVQSRGVGTSLKHFAVNNQETDRMRVSAEVDERTLHEIYLAAFEHVVTTARPWTVMCSYNRINGTSASEHRGLLTDTLRRRWGFDGLVVSDWGAVTDRVAALAAGLDLEMPESGVDTTGQIVAAVEGGDLEPEVLDGAARRVLELVARAAAGLDQPVEAFDPDAHHDLAREAAAGSVVLLKNEGAVLPLDPASGGLVAVIGELARTPRYQGAGSSQVNPTKVEAALDHIGRLAGASGVGFAPGYGLDAGPGGADAGDPAAAGAGDDPGTPSRRRDEAVALAAGAEVAVVFLGLPASEESEGFDREHLDLPAAQIDLLAAVAAVARRVVVVLANGAPVLTSSWEHHADAILEGWLGGQAGGAAVADLLFGEVAPSGRLAETIPRRLEDTPAYLNFPGEGGTVRYGEGLYVGYRYYDAVDREVSYPFGHGLTYTTFGYDDLVVEVGGDGGLDVAFTVTNTGARRGYEVAQVYVADDACSLDRPKRELKGWSRIGLDAGRSAVVRIALDRSALAFWDPVAHDWVVEGGRFTVHVGASSRDLRLAASVHVDAPARVEPLRADSTLAEWLAHPDGAPVLAEALAATGAGAVLDGLRAEPSTFRMMAAMPLDRLAAFPGMPLGAGAVDALLGRLAGRPASGTLPA